MGNILKVGVMTSPHRIKGEVKIFPTTDDAKRFKKLKKVILNTGKEYIPMEVEHVRFFKNMVILKFKGYDNINEIGKYKSKDLLITGDQAVDLTPDGYFITDLVGLVMISSQDVGLGALKDVLEAGANGVYVVAMEDGEELMLPAIGDCILDVDLEQRRMEVRVLEGLMDL